jgi:hypothetical protein
MTADSLHHALCLNHPRREAAARCTSCGRPFCRECVTEFEGRMVCSACHLEKSKVTEKPRRDWVIVTASLQFIIGLAVLWLSAWMLGRVLLSIPSEFHEGTTWERFTF